MDEKRKSFTNGLKSKIVIRSIMMSVCCLCLNENEARNSIKRLRGDQHYDNSQLSMTPWYIRQAVKLPLRLSETVKKRWTWYSLLSKWIFGDRAISVFLGMGRNLCSPCCNKGKKMSNCLYGFLYYIGELIWAF